MQISNKTILIIMFIFFIYFFYKINKLEKEQFSSTSQEQLKQTIKDIYQADIGAIRTLSDIAGKLQAGGITVPGNLTITGDVISNVVKTAFIGLGNKGANILVGGQVDNEPLYISGAYPKTIGTGDRRVQISESLSVDKNITTDFINCNNLNATNIAATGNITALGVINAGGFTIGNMGADLKAGGTTEPLYISGKYANTYGTGDRNIRMSENVTIDKNLNCVSDGFNSCIFYVTGINDNTLISVALEIGLYIASYSLAKGLATGSAWVYIINYNGSHTVPIWYGSDGHIEWGIVNSNQVTAKYGGGGGVGTSSLRIVKICNF
jgi:hypothetical protein